MSIGEMLAATVPMARTMKLEFVETTPEKTVVTLPDQGEFHNHVGGPHAGAMFTLAETASGAIVIGNFEDLIATGVTPLAATATIDYTRLAKGDVTATATLGRPADEIRAELAETGKTTQFPVTVDLATAEGETGRMTICWALRPPR